MAIPIKMLIVEDSESDAQLVVRLLKKAGYEISHEVVETSAQMQSALQQSPWDIVISDYSLPKFDGPAALKILQESELDIPFISVSGTMGEETAVAMMKAGANDYLMKDKLARLVPAVERELRDVEVRRKRKMADEALRKSKNRLNQMLQTTDQGIYGVDLDGYCTFINNSGLKMLGYELDDCLGKDMHDLIHHSFRDGEPYPITDSPIFRAKLTGVGYQVDSEVLWRKDGSSFPAKYSSYPSIENGNIIGAVVTFSDITERKRAEEALSISEERLRKAQQIAHIGNWELDLKTKNIWGSEEAFRIYGIERTNEYLPLPLVQQAVMPEYRPSLGVALDNLIFHNQKYDFEFKIKRMSDGQERFIHSQAELVVNRKGAPIKVNGTLQDITERKLSEDVLRESETKHSSMVANISDVIGIIGSDGIMKYKSPNIEKWFGWQPQDLVGTDGWVTVHPDDLARIQKEFNSLLQKDNSSAIVEYRYKCKDGNYKPIELTAVNLTNDPIIKGVLLNYHDITERKLAENKIRESDLRFGKLSANVPDLIFQFTRRVDGTYYVPIASVGIKNIFGCLPEDVLNDFAPIGSVIHPDDVARVIADIEYSAEHLTFFTCEFRVQIPGKDIQWIYSRSTPEKLADGSVTWYGFNTDTTLRKLAEEKLRNIETRLRQTEKMEAIGQLAGGIAHDFNNVLGGIIGFTDLSLNYADKGSLLEKNLLNVLKAADRAKNLVKQILTFSRQSNTQKKITLIRPIIEEVLELLKSSIPSSVIIEVNIQHDTKHVLVDSTQLHQALLNLATNAVHAMNRKGKLSVRLFTTVLDTVAHGQSGELKPGEYNVIEIADTGCGMDAMTISKAFEPFFTTKAIGEGTGMGLSVVLGIVQSHGGDIQVESELERGTTFRIYLPAINEPMDESVNSIMPVSFGGNERILFVDDEQMLIDMAESSLTPIGYKVTFMSNSVDALEFIKAHGQEIDLLITDQTMPGLTGIELANGALKIRKDLPIILCTGYSREVNPERAHAIGVKQIVMKPYLPHEISKAIRDVLNSK